MLHLAVHKARTQGVTWADVGRSLGVSRQAAYKRFAKAPAVISEIDGDTGALPRNLHLTRYRECKWRHEV